jgi:DNA-binding transcriptional MerR regulator
MTATNALREGEMSIGEVSKQTGLPTATINFYVREGVIPRPRKLNRTRAAYSDTHLRWLKLIKRTAAQGLPLAEIRRYVEFFGADEAGLKKLEGIGSLQARPRPWNDPNPEPIEPFEPEGRAAFLDRTGVSGEVLDQLEAWGVLRPRSPGSYDCGDALLVANIRALLADDVPLERLRFFGDLARELQPAAELYLLLMSLHRRELVARELRVRDLFETFAVPFGYLMDRLRDEADPHWREQNSRMAGQMLEERNAKTASRAKPSSGAKPSSRSKKAKKAKKSTRSKKR